MPDDIAAPIHDFPEQLDQVDIAVADDNALIVAYDHDGAMIGSFGLWIDEDGITWLRADFADGYALIGVSPELGEVYREQQLPADVLAERAELLLVALDDPGQPAAKKRSWGECAWKTVAAGAACWTVRPIACGFGAIKAGCACVPKLIKEFEPYECPWGL